MSSRLAPSLTLPQPPNDKPYLKELHQALTRWGIEVNNQVNAISEGNVSGNYNAITSQPTTIIMNQGDIVRKINPTETGTASNKYVPYGWLAVVAGTASAASSVELRIHTGS